MGGGGGGGVGRVYWVDNKQGDTKGGTMGNVWFRFVRCLRYDSKQVLRRNVRVKVTLDRYVSFLTSAAKQANILHYILAWADGVIVQVARTSGSSPQPFVTLSVETWSHFCAIFSRHFFSHTILTQKQKFSQTINWLLSFWSVQGCNSSRSCPVRVVGVWHSTPFWWWVDFASAWKECDRREGEWKYTRTFHT